MHVDRVEGRVSNGGPLPHNAEGIKGGPKKSICLMGRVIGGGVVRTIKGTRKAFNRHATGEGIKERGGDDPVCIHSRFGSLWGRRVVAQEEGSKVLLKGACGVSGMMCREFRFYSGISLCKLVEPGKRECAQAGAIRAIYKC
jgi:hypothetical protein